MPGSTFFVGRERELSRLNKHLADALAGGGNICLSGILRRPNIISDRCLVDNIRARWRSGRDQ